MAGWLVREPDAGTPIDRSRAERQQRDGRDDLSREHGQSDTGVAGGVQGESAGGTEGAGTTEYAAVGVGAADVQEWNASGVGVDGTVAGRTGSIGSVSAESESESG